VDPEKIVFTLVVVIAYGSIFCQSRIHSNLNKINPDTLAGSFPKITSRMKERVIKKGEKIVERFQRQEEEIWDRQRNGTAGMLANNLLEIA
jgi:hypothetical protein